ncbi:MAG: chemotaxis protein CheA [Armatimonadetes bacterium]|nr:chemotaxis protein CheA [Armatimonadota bacterium]
MVIDMSEMRMVFLEEAREQMELMEQDFLALEKEASPDLLQRIFRAAHTLKGSSRAMGYLSMGDLTHAMEDVLDRLRQDRITVTLPLIDALFEGLDALKQMKDEIAEIGDTALDAAQQTEALRNLLEENTGTTRSVLSTALPFCSSLHLTEEQNLTLEEARKADCISYHLIVTLEAECMMKSVRAVMVLQALETVGAVIAVNPDEECLENEQFDDTFEILLASQTTPDEIAKAVKRVSEVQAVQVTLWEQERESAPTNSPPIEPVSQEAKPEAKASIKQSSTIRVDVARLDKLINLIGELVVDRTRLTQIGLKFTETVHSSALSDSLNETAAHIGRITDELQEEVMKARMLPIENVFSRFPRMVRDITQKLGKEVNLVIEGKETELDRSVIEVISDPLIHMLRNSLDHGIEAPDEREKSGKPRAGSVWIRARHEESHVVIEIEDDGRGIDPQRIRNRAVEMGILTSENANRLTDAESINLIFTSGLTTAKELSDVSGRGVGMDIVRANLEKLGGSVSIDSRLGRGSRFKVKLPLTLAIIRALLVEVREGVFALPLSSVVETLKIERSQIHNVQHREVILHRGKTLPILRMAGIFPNEGVMTPAEKPLAKGRGEETVQEVCPLLDHFMVVVGYGEKQVGLLVSRLIGEQEIVIKSLGRFVGDIPGISGATILGDGRVGLIVDVNGLIQFSIEGRSAPTYP